MRWPSANAFALGAAVAFWLVGAFFLCFAGYYFLKPLVGMAEAPLHEYGMGAMFGGIFSLAAFLCAACLSNKVKTQIARRNHLVLALPALIVGVGFFAVYILGVLVSVAD